MAINPWLQAAGAAATSAPARAAYGSILRNARLPNTGQTFPMPANMLLRRFGSTLDSNPGLAEEPAQEEELPLPPVPPPVPEAIAPTTPAAVARPQNTDGESPEMLEALRQMQANLRAQHMTTQPQQQQLSVLDMLRKRMARDMEGEALQRVGEFGAGMLASGSPNFFTMLGAGARAAREGDVSRMDQLRRLADLERQDAAQRAEEARRIEELRIREEDQRLMAPYRAALTQQALATAADIRAGRGRGTISISQRLQAERDAARGARIAHPDLPAIPAPTAAQQAELQRLREAYIARELPRLLEAAANPGQAPAAAPGAAAGAPATPSVRIDASGREIR